MEKKENHIIKKTMDAIQEMIEEVDFRRLPGESASQYGTRMHDFLQSFIHSDSFLRERTATEVIIDSKGVIKSYAGSPSEASAMVRTTGEAHHTVDIVTLKKGVKLDPDQLLGRRLDEVADYAVDFKTGRARLKGIQKEVFKDLDIPLYAGRRGGVLKAERGFVMHELVGTLATGAFLYFDLLSFRYNIKNGNFEPAFENGLNAAGGMFSLAAHFAKPFLPLASRFLPYAGPASFALSTGLAYGTRVWENNPDFRERAMAAGSEAEDATGSHTYGAIVAAKKAIDDAPIYVLKQIAKDAYTVFIGTPGEQAANFDGPIWGW